MPKGGVKGNSGGKKGRSGRVSKARILGLKEMLDEGWPQDKRVEFFKKLSEMARGGHVEAGKLLMNYTFGKAPETHNLQGGIKIRIVDESSDIE